MEQGDRSGQCFFFAVTSPFFSLQAMNNTKLAEVRYEHFIIVRARVAAAVSWYVSLAGELDARIYQASNTGMRP